jgi:hypothetical protein
MIERDFEPHFSIKHMLKDMQIADQLGLSHYLDLRVTGAARDQLLEQMRWGRGDDDFSAVARKYLPEAESPRYDEPQLPEEEQASPDVIEPALAGAPVLTEALFPDAATNVDSAGSREVKRAIPWRRGFLTQLLRRGRQLRKRSEPVSSKEG